MSDAALVFRVGWEMMRGQLSWMPREGIRLAMRGSEETDGLMGSRLAGNFQLCKHSSTATLKRENHGVNEVRVGAAAWESGSHSHLSLPLFWDPGCALAYRHSLTILTGELGSIQILKS